MEQLEQGRAIITRLLDSEVDDVALLHDEIKRLRSVVALSREERSLRLADVVRRIFPGSFGRMMAFMYAPFFDVEIRTAEQKARWLQLVEYLDDLTEPPVDHPFLQLTHVENETRWRLN